MAILRTYNPETGKWEEVPVVAGKNGKSAYEYAKEGGFTGTEAEFSAQLGSTASVLGEAKQYTDDKVRDASNESAVAIGALQEAVNGKAAASDLASHVGNASNPHGVTAAQIGADESGAAAAALEEAKQYTDDEIAELINGAPTTLDTLGEIATAMADNADVVTALHEAVGSKAAAADLTAHTGNKNNPHGVTAAQLGALTSDRLFLTLVPTGTKIPANADLNTIEYLKVGRYYCSQSADAATIKNCPLRIAFMMEVSSPLSTNIDNETTNNWCFRMRTITHYKTGAKYTQYCGTSGTAGEWTYGDWYVPPLATFKIDTNDLNGGTAVVGNDRAPVYIDGSGIVRLCNFRIADTAPSEYESLPEVADHTGERFYPVERDKNNNMAVYVPQSTAAEVGALPIGGGTMTGAITLPNNTAIKSKDGSGAAQEVLRANGSNQIVLGAAGIWDLIVSYHGLVPATSAVDALDLGAGGRRWRNLFLSGSISDGTNSVKIADIAKKNDIPTVPDKTENWTFTLEDGSTVTKAVYLK